MENQIMKGLTFDDVLLEPRYSEVLPRDVNVSTRLTRQITLSIPLVSAAMDTVTEHKLAIALAYLGGIGFIHKNLPIEWQAAEVKKVKKATNIIIDDPVTLPTTATVADIRALVKAEGVSSILVVKGRGRRLVGIVTKRDLDTELSPGETPITAVMTKKVITVFENPDISEVKKLMREHRVEKIPVISDRKNRKLVGMYTLRDILVGESFPSACKDDKGRLRVGAAVGVTADVLDRVTLLIKMNVDVVCVDTAHGHSQGVIETVKQIKEKHPSLPVIAGNVATEEGARALIEAGVDAVKVGVGPGSICTTRVTTGIGMPQLTAIIEAGNACRKADVPLIADGGIRYAGDITKALAAGADTVMIGSIFAGTEESPGETVLLDGRKYKSYRGMGSLEAMQKGSKDRYFQDAEYEIGKLVPEGVVGLVPYKGDMSEVVYQLIGGLRSGMGYCGASTLPNLRENARFIEITDAGRKESHPHGVVITKEAPNYSVPRE